MFNNFKLNNININGQPQFTKEQMDEMMKDPKFQEMFKNAQAGTAGTSGNSDGTVNPEFC